MRNLILTLLSFCICVGCIENGENSIKLLPKGYTGPVLIVFNQPNGEPKEYEDGKRLYRIPKDGILKTKFEPDYGIHNHQFFYEDSLGHREIIPFVIVQDKELLSKIEDKSKIHAFAEQARSEVKGYDPEFGKYTISPTREFFIGNLLDIEKSYREVRQFSLENLKQFRIYE